MRKYLPALPAVLFFFVGAAPWFIRLLDWIGRGQVLMILLSSSTLLQTIAHPAVTLIFIILGFACLAFLQKENKPETVIWTPSGTQYQRPKYPTIKIAFLAFTVPALLVVPIWIYFYVFPSETGLIASAAKEKIDSFKPSEPPPFVASHVIREREVLLTVTFTLPTAVDQLYVICTVTDPDRQLYWVPTMEATGGVDTVSTTLRYPFANAPPLRSGRYYVAWQLASDKQVIATDIFEIR